MPGVYAVPRSQCKGLSFRRVAYRCVQRVRYWLWECVRRHWPILLPAGLLGLILHAWFSPGLIVGEDFHAPPIAASFGTLDHSGIWPPSYDMSSGGFNLQSWWPSFPLWMIVGLLHGHGVSWEIIERVLWLWPCYILLIVAPYRFFYNRGLSTIAAAVGATVFAVNTWTIALIERGHIPAIVGYALMPLAVDAFLKLLDRLNYRSLLAFAVILTFQSMYEVRYAFLTIVACALVVAIRLCLSPRSYSIKHLATVALVTGATFALMNFYWLAPTIVTPVTVLGGSGLNALGQISGGLSLLNSVALYYPYYHHNLFNDPFKADRVEAQFLLITALAVLGFYWGRRRWYGLALSAIGILAIITGSGPASQFGSAAQFLYAHFLAFAGFRDLTRLMSLVGFASALGVALAINRICAWLRLRRLAACGYVLAIGAVLAIGFICRDAFNPFRLSNFAVTPVSSEDRALQDFIDNAPGSGRVLLFPVAPLTVESSSLHSVYPGAIGGGTPSFGALVAGNGGALDFYHSTLAQNITREIGAQYLVVVDDPSGSMYWNYKIGKNEAVNFFDTLPWLKRIKTIGGHVVYSIRDSRPYRAAFYADCPVSVLADSRSTDMLLGFGLVHADPGIVFGPEQSPAADLNLLPNVFVAPIALAPSEPYGLMNGAVSAVRYIPRPYAAFAIDQATMGYPVPSYLKATWTSALDDGWQLAAQIGPSRVFQAPVLIRTFTRALSSVNSPVGRALLTGGEIAAYFSDGVSATLDNGGSRINPVSTITIVNPFDEPVTADLVFPGFAADSSWTTQISIQGNDFEKTITITGDLGISSLVAPPDTRIRSVALAPGLNQFKLSSPVGAMLSSDPYISNPVLTAGKMPAGDLSIVQYPAKGSVEIVGLPQAASGTITRRRLRVADGIGIPVGHFPSVHLRYSMRSDIVTGYVAYGLRDARLGYLELREPLDNAKTDLTFDVAHALREAFASQWNQAVKNHTGDIAWLTNNYGSSPDWSGPVLNYVDIVLVNPDSASRTRQSLTLFSIAIGTRQSQNYQGPFNVSSHRVDLSHAQVSFKKSQSGALSITQTPSAVTINLSNMPPPQAVAPADMRQGDSVTLQLVNNRTVKGRIMALNASTLIIALDGQSFYDQPIGVRRSAIASIEAVSRNPADIVVRIPVNLPPDTGEFRLALSAPSGYSTSMSLGVAGATSASVQLAPVTDQTNVATSEPPIPANWMQTQPVQGSGAPQGMGDITSVGLQAIPPQVHSVVDLDLNQIYRTHLPALPDPQLRFVELRFVGSPVYKSFLQSIEISGAESVIGSERTSKVVPRQTVPLLLDGRRLSWKSFGMNTGAVIVKSRSIHLKPGTHYLQTYGAMQGSVQSALAEHGFPMCKPLSPSYKTLNNSEVGGSLANEPGLIVQNTTYDSNWRLAILPPGVSPSGNVVADYMRFRSNFVPDSSHFVVNGDLNGWWIGGGKSRVLMLFVPTAVSDIAATLEIPILIFVLIVLRRILP
jgi:hypothetical protein